jgi:hypothetical protein
MNQFPSDIFIIDKGLTYKAKFIKISSNSYKEGRPHSVTITNSGDSYLK